MNRLPLSLWEQWLNSPGAMRLGSALLHFVWQGALLAGIAWLLLFVLKRAKPQIRYVVLLAVFGALAVCPAVTYFMVEVAIANVAADSGSLNAQNRSLSRSAESPAGDKLAFDSNSTMVTPALTGSGGEFTHVNSMANSSPRQPATSSEVAWHSRLNEAGEWLQQHRHWVVALWLAGVCLVSMRLAAGLIGAEQARRRGASADSSAAQQIVARLAARLNIRRTVRVLESALAEAPALVGWLRPVILLPTSALIGLTPTQLEAILTHELAHVARHDYLVNLLQTVVETILFYHPAVWWISRRIRQEREHCCDDLAIALCADRIAYARALTAMEELCAAPARWVVAARGGSLVERIRRIVGRPEPARNSRPALAAITAVLIFLTGVTIHLRQTVSAGDPAARAATSTDDRQKKENRSAENKAADESGKRRVVGRVVDEQGKPVANANLCWQVMSTADGKDESIQGTSDSNGEFQLEAPVAWKPEPPSRRSDMLWVLARGRCLTVVRAKNEAGTDDKADELEIRLEPATDTAFEVFDHTGTPLAGAVIEPLHFRSPQGYGIIPESIRKLLRVTADNAGKVRMPEMPRKGFYSVQVTAESFGIQQLRLDPRASAPAERLLTLRQTGRIEGRLIADKPEWMRGIKLSFETAGTLRQVPENVAYDPDGYAIAVTDNEGRFVVPAIASGNLRIYVHTANDSPVLPQQPDNVQLSSGATTEIEIPLVDTVLVRGSVLTEDEQTPVPGAEIHVYYGVQRQGGNVVTDREGRYELRVLPGGVGTQIIVMPNDFSDRYEQVGSPWSERQQVPADVKEFELAPILLSPVATVEGKLLDHRGRPLAKAQINGLHQNRRYGFTVTDEKGHFSVKFPRKIALESYQVWLDDGQTLHAPRIEQDDPLILKLDASPDSEAETGNEDKNKATEAEQKREPPEGEQPSPKQPEKAASDARRPWSVHGRVTDAEGRPLAGVVVTAHTGMGTLRETGKAESDAQGNYAFDFGPGILFGKDDLQLQAATIAARKPGFSEKNLSRQGGLRAALKLPAEKAGSEKASSEKLDAKNIILPGQSREIDFVMVPAAKVAGRLIDKDAAPLAGYSISLKGDELPPSSSVVASTKTDEQGRFVLADVPAGFKWQFLIEPAKRQPPWNAWASGRIVFRADDGNAAFFIQGDGQDLAASQFELQVVGEGLNWKEALQAGESQQRLDITGYSLTNKSSVQAASARLVLAMPAVSAPAETPVAKAAASSLEAGRSKTNLKRTKPGGDGRFSVTFDNPITKRDAQRWTLDPEKHQVIFQVFVKDAEGLLVEKVFKQLAARETGGYRVDVQVKPELIDTSSISITFVTIQPEHDQWVKAFFHEGKGTSYKGLWSGDAGKLSALTVE